MAYSADYAVELEQENDQLKVELAALQTELDKANSIAALANRNFAELLKRGEPAEFKPIGEFDYHRRQWDKIKSNRGQEGMSVIISSLSGDTNTLSIPNDMARDLLARMSEADI